MAKPFYVIGGQMEEVEPLLISQLLAKMMWCFGNLLMHTLALMLENVVMEVGVENVVQIITDNAATYVVAGKFNFLFQNQYES